MALDLEGHLLAPKQAQKHPARVSLDSRGFVSLSSEQHQCKVHIEFVEVADAIGTMARNLTFEGGWVFVAAKPEELNRWLKQHKRHSRLSVIERRPLLAICFSLALLVIMWGGYRYGLPLASKTLAAMVPVSVQEHLGEYSRDSLDSIGLGESQLDEATKAQVQKRFDSLLATLEQQGVQFSPKPKLYFMGSAAEEEMIDDVPSSSQTSDTAEASNPHPGMVNAFALADGSVVLTDAMVKLADAEGELEAVLLHELGHHHHRHLMTSVVQSTLLSVAVAMIIGDSSGLANVMASTAVLGLTLGYSRDNEREADAFAISQMTSSHGSAEPLASLYQKLKQQPGMFDVPDWLSTHPDLNERIENIRAH
ncbi:M48 family metallopeptidase [Shewanella khirikhana]|uniref:TPR repeat-containing protein YfgC n=1 Tax=Shewanella khirikhana TaxID=1965282 RepID=A0ABM7DWV5_9GAMM|nr:M48 family metallopeptidase [Shewanella khirikhana]AZQ13064.1 TPR repeat-containing protein YfgC precursor [Shewanella khirikhana]